MNTITRTDTPIDVTAVRRQLVQQGDEQLAQRRPFFKVMHGTLHGRQDAPRIEDVDGAAAWAYEGLVSAGTFAHTLAYVLRLLEQDAPEVALKVAAVVERVLDAGMDALEDANADLDEQAGPVPVPTADLHVTFGPSKPGVGKSLAAALMENDVPPEPETTPAVTS